MSDEHELYATGRLIQWALQPQARPALDSEYRELLERYLNRFPFRETVRAIASGLGLHIVDSGPLGVVLAPGEDSIFAARASDYRPSGDADDRLIDGFIQVAIIATLYPRAQDLEDAPMVARPPFRVEDIEATLRDLCDRLEAAARHQPDPPVDDRARGLYEAWRTYREKASAKGTESTRGSPATTRRMIEHGLDFLPRQGCLLYSSQGGRQEYRPTWRYQVLIQEWSATRIFTVVRSLLDSSSTSKEG